MFILTPICMKLHLIYGKGVLILSSYVTITKAVCLDRSPMFQIKIPKREREEKRKGSTLVILDQSPPPIASETSLLPQSQVYSPPFPLILFLVIHQCCIVTAACSWYYCFCSQPSRQQLIVLQLQLAAEGVVPMFVACLNNLYLLMLYIITVVIITMFSFVMLRQFRNQVLRPKLS